MFPLANEVDGAALAEAHESGRAELCTVDEAEVRAVGYVANYRGAKVPEGPYVDRDLTDDRVVDAGRRLVSRGLARPEPTARSVVTPSGALLAFVGGVLARDSQLWVLSQYEDPTAVIRRRRVTVLGGGLGYPMTLVETTDVPLDAGEAPLPVKIEAVRPDVLFADLDAAMFETPLAPGVTRTLDLTAVTTGFARFGRDRDDAILMRKVPKRRGTKTTTRRATRADLQRLLLEQYGDLLRAGAERLNAATR